ncbi:hypothetical protein [Musicola paradisiaca]|uniref:Uncharacterized protein n=1 Tax=Musicola paradisiaca (strain Ech703) TaxID=579405 RepID=C6C7R8_MUSP7|nr:hypothetical protein [Musicola paradisiaca]ACS86010.1 hypothetical protein Dd703_2223 [Musicola paradisiaca Ech703]
MALMVFMVLIIFSFKNNKLKYAKMGGFSVVFMDFMVKMVCLEIKNHMLKKGKTIVRLP